MKLWDTRNYGTPKIFRALWEQRSVESSMEQFVRPHGTSAWDTQH